MNCSVRIRPNTSQSEGDRAAQADALQAQGVGAGQAGRRLERRQVHAAGPGLLGDLDLQGRRPLVDDPGPGEGLALARGDVGDGGLEGRRQLAGGGVDQQLQQPRLGVGDLDHPAQHVQRRAGMGLAQEADVLFADHHGGVGVGREGVRQAQLGGQARQALHGPHDVVAHIHVPHLVAVPGVDATTPDLDAGEGLGAASWRLSNEVERSFESNVSFAVAPRRLKSPSGSASFFSRPSVLGCSAMTGLLAVRRQPGGAASSSGNRRRDRAPRWSRRSGRSRPRRRRR
jgi:hypothetical protein